MAEFTSIEKDMALSHADFWRLFPRVAPPHTERAAEVRRGDEFGFAWRDGRVRVQLGPEQAWSMASLSMTRTHVTLGFEGLPVSDIDEFVARFDRCFQRGGG